MCCEECLQLQTLSPNVQSLYGREDGVATLHIKALKTSIFFHNIKLHAWRHEINIAFHTANLQCSSRKMVSKCRSV